MTPEQRRIDALCWVLASRNIMIGEEGLAIIATAIREAELAARARTRKACAELVEAGPYHWLYKSEIANAIRARTEQQEAAE